MVFFVIVLSFVTFRKGIKSKYKSNIPTKTVYLFIVSLALSSG